VTEYMDEKIKNKNPFLKLVRVRNLILFLSPP
jgi:hypothetical protein